MCNLNEFLKTYLYDFFFFCTGNNNLYLFDRIFIGEKNYIFGEIWQKI